MITFLLAGYIFMEYQNYIRYKNKRATLNNYKRPDMFDKIEMEKRINILCEDIENENIEIDIFVKEMFKGLSDINNISYDEIYNALHDNMYSVDNKNIYRCEIEKIISTLEKKLNIKFLNRNENVNKHVTIHKDDILAWYRPLLFNIGLKLAKTPSEYYLKNVLGFKRVCLKDGIVMWIKPGSEKCVLFIPACIGGITFYPYFIKKIDQSNTIMIPEIPEMSWNNGRNIIPPNLSEISHEIINCVIDNNIKSLNMIGHSFGTIVMNHIVNQQYIYLKSNNVKLDKLIYIEGLLFYANVFSTLNTIEDPFHKILVGNARADITTMSLFQRDLYVKFYIKRCLSLMHSVLSGASECEKECKVYALMGSDDNKFITKDYVNYIENRKLPIKYKVFDGCMHGAFVWNNEMQQHVLNILKC